MSNELDLSWFDLSKYEPVKHFTLDDWFIQLSRRIGFKTCYDDQEPEIMFLFEYEGLYGPRDVITESDFEEREISETLDDDLQKIQDNPTNLYSGFFDNGNRCIFTFGAVRLTEPNDIPKEVWKYTNDSEAFSKPINMEGTTNKNALFSIELNAPESVLIEQFRTLIREQKKQLSAYRKKSFTDADIASWYSLNILPCIDLLIYQNSKGIKIKQGMLDKMLFPDGDVTDKVRRTVLPKINEVFTPQSILAMEFELTA